MADNDTQMLRISVDALELLRAIATVHGNSMGKQAAILIEQAHAQLFSQPSPITIDEAQTAHAGAIQ